MKTTHTHADIFPSSLLLRIFAFLLVNLFVYPLVALDPTKPTNAFLIDQWDITIAPPATTIITISQTPEGYLWIATTTGLIRFDGLTFTMINFLTGQTGKPQACPIPDTLFLDHSHTLWIGSVHGLTSYHHQYTGQTGHFHTYSAPSPPWERIRYIKEDHNHNLWSSFFSSYLIRFKDGTFTPFNNQNGLTAKKINAIVETSKQELLFGSRENGLFTFKGNTFSRAPITLPPNLYLITLFLDKKENLWIATTKGLFRHTPTGLKHVTETDGLSNDYITTIYQDSQDNLWIGTMKGLNRLQYGEGNGLHIESILKNDLITCLFEDNEKSLWVGTYASGLKRLRDHQFIVYPPSPQLTDQQLLSLYEDSTGNIWAGTLSGSLFRIKNRVVVENILFPELANTGITAITEDQEHKLWLATNGKGVFMKDNTQLLHFTTQDGLADNLVTAIQCSSNGDLWFSTFAGVSVKRKNATTLTSLSASNGLPAKVVHQVYEDHHKNIWLATDNGLIQLPDGQWHAPRISSFFPGLVISCVYEETPSTPNLSPVYWFATHGAGFKRWQGKTITSYTLDNGLTSDFIYQFFLTPSRHFWLMSKSGLLRLDKTELENYATRMTQQVHCITFDNTEGMLSIEFNNELSPSSALALRNHELWWVTKLGIAMIQPQKVTIHKQAPAAIIERVLYNGKPVNQPLATLPFNSEIELRFYFTAPSFLAPQKIPFLYQLAPVDKSPVLLPAGQERVVSYSHLKPGKYCFRITAANANGFWNSHYATFRFDIKARFEQTFMFKAAIAGLSIIVMVFLYLLFRRKSLKKEEKYKNSSLNPQFVEECIKKLNRIMEIEKLYLDVDISLSILAEKISVSPHILSQILNEQMNRKFSDYINMYRIEEVKRILATHRGAQQKIAAIALDVGFNTTVAFYSAFKKYTGQTPIQYKKQLVSANKHSMPTDSLD